MGALQTSPVAIGTSPEVYNDQNEQRPASLEQQQQQLGQINGFQEQLSGVDLLLVSLLVGLILLSIVGNCLVCVAIFTDRRLRKLGNAFIVSLAIADLFVSCLVMTFALCNDLMNYWIFGDWFCDVWISFDIMCCTASILNLCAISLDRFIHIKDCLLYNQWMTRKVAVSAVILIWFISALVSFVPTNLGWHKPAHLNSYTTAAAASAYTLTPTTTITIMEAAAGESNHSLRHPHLGHFSNPVEPQLKPQPRPQLKLKPRAIGNHNHATGAPKLLSPDSGHWANNGSDLAAGSQMQSLSSDSHERPSNQTNVHLSIDRLQFNPNVKMNAPLPRAALELDPSLTAPEQVGPTTNGAEQQQQQQRNYGPHTDHQGRQLPLCILTLTPTYAVVSSTISFYIPCIIMLGLYIKLFACARRHVRDIQAVSKIPIPIAAPPSSSTSANATSSDNNNNQMTLEQCSASAQATSKLPGPAPLKTWLKFGQLSRQKRSKSNANSRQQSSDKSSEHHNPNTTIPFATSGATPNLSRQETCSSQLSVGANATTNNNQQRQSRQLATHKAAVTLGIIMGTFLFCWVPFFCLNIIKAFCVDCIPASLFRAFTWLGYANSALNPIIYGVHNSEFRCAFNRIFFKHLNISSKRHLLPGHFRHANSGPNFNNSRTSCRGLRNLAQAGSKQSTKQSDAIT